MRADRVEHDPRRALPALRSAAFGLESARQFTGPCVDDSRARALRILPPARISLPLPCMDRASEHARTYHNLPQRNLPAEVHRRPLSAHPHLDHPASLLETLSGDFHHADQVSPPLSARQPTAVVQLASSPITVACRARRKSIAVRG
ncbi:hypothetical protein Bcep18194_C6795 [Burkholderia lata]|uniref:Uncharacterized protein n=1 Tax=Burkholderia lata (strain ATCC 17760 / DSM 23089 / LMG 22485 / NCIMB 9086 / R18194 / 383) TaxID=482957 RepID=Q39NX4_BURL3|nr:hypothetical protein Bcep18194_C6795 [Burkholderia lata]